MRRVRAQAHGVIVGSALARRLLEGGGPDAAATFVGELRRPSMRADPPVAILRLGGRPDAAATFVGGLRRVAGAS